MIPSNSAINKVGNIIRDGEKSPDYEDAISTLNDWRESHGPVLDEYYDKCVNLAAKIDKNNIIVAQRLKRLPTIIGKLNRFPTMRLSSMQDIAGARIIADDMDELKLLEKQIKKWNGLVKVDDYIGHPKDSGYRSIHFIFKKDNMFVEIQLRTKLQHLWATSVETTDLFRKTSLKEKDDRSYWHDFFCQVSSIFAAAENAPAITEYSKMGLNEICSILRNNVQKNSVFSQIESFALTKPFIDVQKTRSAYYMVISLDFKNKEAHGEEFKEDEYKLAFERYERLEKNRLPEQQTVLIALNQAKKIRDAYPNYFVDLTNFVNIIEFLLETNDTTDYNINNE